MPKPATPTGKTLKNTSSRPLVIPYSFIKSFEGDYVKAALVAQLMYWSDKGEDSSGWIYKKHAEWEDELCLSEYRVRRAVEEITPLGFLSYKIKKVDGAPTAHYLLDLDALSIWINSTLEKLGDGNQKNSGFQETEETQVSTLIEHSVLHSLPFIAEAERSERSILPSEETPEDKTEEKPSCSTLANIDLYSPVDEFCWNAMRRLPNVGKPKLKTAANRQTLEKLEQAEDIWGRQALRAAFVAWCDCRDENRFEYLKANKWPIRHFLAHVEEYIPDPGKNAIREAREAPSVRDVAEKAPTATPEQAARPGVPEPRLTPADFVATWNRIVVSKPYKELRTPKFPDGLAEFAKDWERACEAAERIIQAKGTEVSWLCLRWALKFDEVKGDNWYRLASGELDCMAAQEKPMTKGQKDAALADRVMAKYKEKARLAQIEKEKSDGVR